MIHSKFFAYLVFAALVTAACTSKPVKVEAVDSPAGNTAPASEIFQGGSAAPRVNNSDASWTQCEVFETLETERYSYLHVIGENGDTAWVATRKADFQKGGVYRYRNALLKTNYYSTEFDRTFDRIYLVSEIQGRGASPNSNVFKNPEAAPKTSGQAPVAGSTPIAEIVQNASDWSGKTVQVSGEVVKVNPNIMGRNWIHLQDGSMNSFDFVITSEQMVPVGHSVTFKGVLQTDRDFGSGYAYDIILEQGTLVQ